MTGVNKVILLGNATKQAEVRTTTGGTTVCNFSIAVNEKMGKDREEKVQFFNIVAWGKLADICGQYVSKGKQVFVEGRIDFRTDERDGKKTIYTNIIANEVKLLGGGQRDQQPGNNGPASASFPPPAASFDSDDMPF